MKKNANYVILVRAQPQLMISGKKNKLFKNKTIYLLIYLLFQFNKLK